MVDLSDVPPGRVRTLLKHPSAVLLAVQLLGVLGYPFMAESGSRAAFEAFGVVVLGLAIYSTRDAPSPTWIAIVLGVGAAGLSIADAFLQLSVIVTVSAVVHAAFYFLAATNLMVYMLRDRKVTTDELFAVGATFTLVAWAFAYVFTIIQQLQPGAFTAAVDPQAQRTWMELLFLSFTNLSSTGLSDVVPITAVARSWVMIEQLAGLAYVALFVSRLVALTVNRTAVQGSKEG